MKHEDNLGIRIVQIDTADGDHAGMGFDYDGARINISLHANSLPGTLTSDPLATCVEDYLIHLLDRVVSTLDDEEYEDLLNEALELIMFIGKCQFDEAAAQAANHTLPAPLDLHSRLFPDIFEFCLKTVDGNPKLSRISSNESFLTTAVEQDADFLTEFQPDDRLPGFSSKEIICSDVLVQGFNIVSRVQVHGQDMLCKAFKTGLLHPNLLRELGSLQKIRNQHLTASASFRVPKLRGYVVHAKTGAIFGLLRNWIPHGPNGGTLEKVMNSPTSKELRCKWATQIRETVQRLHEIDVTWGDGKPSNVVVDNNDDAWLIDFGGGWSEGWVDEALQNTAAGDNQAVRNITKFLGFSSG